MTDFDSLKEHIDMKFDNHDKIDKLRHERINELLVHYSKEIEDNKKTVKRVHERVDGIDTSIKTVKGVGTLMGGALAAAAAWIGITSK